MANYKLKYKPLGSIAALVEWPYKIDYNILNDINLFRNTLNAELVEYVLDTVPAYNSITVFFNTKKIKYSGIVKKIKEAYKIKNKKQINNTILWKIPVCYEDEFGIDLELLSQSKKISKQKIIKLHSSTIYDVHFIGFLPGFLYLGGLKEALHFERKSTPRQKILKGDVAIANNQTGIYPRVSPGGWNIIGNSPIDFFDVNLDPPCFARSGDKIKFVSVDKTTYTAIQEKVKQGVYIIENERYE